jgi:hypothetical protein
MPSWKGQPSSRLGRSIVTLVTSGVASRFTTYFPDQSRHLSGIASLGRATISSLWP